MFVMIYDLHSKKACSYDSFPHSRPEDLPGIKSFFPKVDLKYIQDVGHNVHAENSPVFLSMANEFLLKNK